MITVTVSKGVPYVWKAQGKKRRNPYSVLKKLELKIMPILLLI